jgi:hypothetical protein
MSVCDSVCVCVCLFVWEVRVCVWVAWGIQSGGLVVQLGLIFHFILNPEQRRVFQLVHNKIQDFKNTFFFQKYNSIISLPVKWEVCEKSTFLTLSS